MAQRAVVMDRAEIWWADLPEPIGRRPVVLISRHKAIQVRENVVIAQVTSRIRGLLCEVPLDAEDGVPKPCVINCDVLHTVPKACLTQRISGLSSAKRL